MVRRRPTPEPERTPSKRGGADWVDEIHRIGRTSGRVISVDENLPASRLSSAVTSAPAASASTPAKPAAAAPAAAPASTATAFYALAVTPLTFSGGVDRSFLVDYAAALKADGVNGVISGSFASEAQLLSLDDRRALISSWGASGLSHIADVTSSCIADVVALATHAKAAGAIAVAFGMPPAYQATSVGDYGQFVAEVSRAVSDLPLLLVHDPKLLRTRNPQHRLSDIVKECASRTNSLRGFIYAGDDLYDFATTLALSKSLPQLNTAIHAHDGTMTTAALQGARSFASMHFSTVAPLLIKSITAAQKADGATLTKMQILAASYFSLISDVANDDPERSVAATKAIASFRLERDLGYMRPPAPRLTVHDVQRLRTGMEAFVAQYSSQVKPATAAPTGSKIDLTVMPGFNGKLDDKIARRAEECSRKAGIRNVLQYFPHLGRSWRGRLPGRDCNVAQYIDHTVLKPECTETEITTLTTEARKHKFYAVCVNGSRVDQCVAELRGTSVQVAAVIGFPLGAMTLKAKAREAKELVQKGCTEIDMVMNVGAMKDGDLKYVYDDIKAVVDASEPAIVKVIFETCLLTPDEIMDASILSVAAGAGFLKTSTGFNKGGATPEAIDIMLAVAGNECQVKASGGVRTAEDALAYITAGVMRIGTSSGIAIVTGAQSAGGY